jgi:hypothetical protein
LLLIPSTAESAAAVGRGQYLRKLWTAFIAWWTVSGAVGMAAPSLLNALTEEELCNRTVWEKFAFYLYGVYKKESKRVGGQLSHKTACDYFNNAFNQATTRYATTTPSMCQYHDGDALSYLR